jgi:hypothetical protein
MVKRFFLSAIAVPFVLVACGDGALERADYGIPDELDLGAPCPADGTWRSYHQKRAFTTPPTLSVERLVLDSWRVDIHPITWENTGVCTSVLGFQVCDYVPRDAGYVIRGYVDPNSGAPDSNGNTRYSGRTTKGQGLFFWDYAAPEKVHLNIDFFVDDRWTKEVMKP